MKKNKLKNKRLMFTLITLAVLSAGALVINAYNSGGPPSSIGHTFNEITPPSGCLNNQVISGGNCVDMPNYGQAGFIPVIYGNIIDSSSVYQTSSGNVGFKTTIPRSKLDVSGRIEATGTICSDTGGCIGDYNPSEHILTGPYTPGYRGSRNIGPHLFCFLTGLKDCGIINNGDGTWNLSGVSKSNSCEAYCIDGAGASDVVECPWESSDFGIECSPTTTCIDTTCPQPDRNMCWSTNCPSGQVCDSSTFRCIDDNECPVTCQDINVECGSYTIGSCGNQNLNCGTCPAGKECYTGKCVTFVA